MQFANIPFNQTRTQLNLNGYIIAFIINFNTIYTTECFISQTLRWTSDKIRDNVYKYVSLLSRWASFILSFLRNTTSCQHGGSNPFPSFHVFSGIPNDVIHVGLYKCFLSWSDFSMTTLHIHPCLF